MRTSLLLLAALLAPAHAGPAWSAKYAVDCPQRCDSRRCAGGLSCRRRVMDDCGCCWVCAAERGATCYRTVAGVDGMKCGPGLRCQFYREEDEFGDEFGICKDCPYGTFGTDCKGTCSCQLGICDRVTGECVTFPLFQHPGAKSAGGADLRAEHGVGSGDGNAVTGDLGKENAARSPVRKWLNPR
ncbi:endothelial cell-specific molecule 1 [Molossus molossus]|uniref:Endothelial cell specific molecule 1 n=1 Tax=Molossus molossus TaxID=27622 RepID=A0A7J8IXL3_MOLMO|nr:endothelial cell-specific molecule 1 [Molossus molossus]KAF6489357.1 endothelial cell specific molecule 1 [Molossus molossus]